MRQAPFLNYTSNKQVRQVVQFGGVRYGRGGQDGEFSETLNLSSRQYPTLSQRGGRRTSEKEYTSPSSLYARGELVVVDGTDLYYGDKVVGQVVPGEKQFATINTKVVIFPDKVYYDTKDDKFGLLEAWAQFPPGSITWTDSTITRTKQGDYYPSLQGASELILSSTEKVKAYTGIKIDQSSGALTFEGETDKTGANLKPDDVLKVDGQADRFRVVVSTSRKGNNITVSYREYMVKQQKVPPFTDVFSVNQAVEITGSSIEANNKTAIIRKVEENKLTFYEKTFSTGSESGTVNIKRNVPDLTVVCESDNRIWGADQTTIWASALGDPAAWYTYDGLSTDSFSVAVGTDGAFTGCIAYGSNVLFFKENHLHKVLGSFPAEYRIYTYNIPGVQEGSNKSLCVINEVLFYKGISGVYSYTGSTPVLISENFGLRLFDQAHAGADVDRYYISMRDSSNGLWNLFVFDTVRAIWLREDDSHAVDFAWLEGQLYMMDADAKKIVLLNQDDGQEVRFPWSAEFAPLDDNSYGKRGYSRLYLYLELDPGAWVRLDKREDNGPWQQVRTWSAENAMSVTAGVMPGRCSRFQIRLSGNGRCVVKNFVREFDVGGDK